MWLPNSLVELNFPSEVHEKRGNFDFGSMLDELSLWKASMCS